MNLSNFDLRLKLAALGLILLVIAQISLAYVGTPFLYQVGVGLLTLGGLVVFWYQIKGALGRVRQATSELATEEVSQKQERKTGVAPILDRIKEEQQKQTTRFALLQALTQKEEKIDFSQAPEDAWTQVLQQLYHELSESRSFQENQQWTLQGLNYFSEMLRVHAMDMQDFGESLIREVVKYMKANQGGLFIVEEENGTEFLELIGCYAWDRRKRMQKRVEWGEGLAGQCLRDKEMLYLTDIPADYVNITSGLGYATPRQLLILPLAYNEKVYGVLEIAGFEVFSDSEVNFLQQLSEDVAATLANLRHNRETQNLLKSSQELTEELQQREEEMRQNMEELTATQETMERKQRELDGVFAAIDQSMLKAEFFANGMLKEANKHFARFLGGEMHGHISLFDLFKKSEKAAQVRRILQEEGKCDVELEVRGDSIKGKWLSMTLATVLDANGEVEKILMLGQDITERIQREQQMERLSLVADNTDNAVVITDPQGRVEFTNQGLEKMTGYTLAEIKGKKPGEFLQGPETNQDTIARMSRKLKAGEPVYEEILNYKKNGETYWVSLAINTVKGEDGEIKKFISVQADITETKSTALDHQYKLEAIGRSNAVIEFDTQGNILSANENFLKIFGYEEAEVIGKHHRIFVKEEEAASPEYAAFWKKIGSGEFVSNEFQRVAKDGRIIWLKGIYNPIFDINGKPIKVVKFAVDVTLEKELQLENKKRQVELQHHMEAIHNTLGSLEFDVKGKIIGANHIFLAVTGFTLEEIKGKSYFDLLPEKERFKPQYQIMWESLQEGKFFSGEFKQMDKAGSEVWLSGTINPIFDINDELQKVMLFAQFTTKEKEKLFEQNEMLQIMNGVIPVLEINQDCSIKSANELFLNATGYRRLELRKLSCKDIVSIDGEGTMQEIVKRLEHEEFVTTQLRLMTKDHETIRSRVVLSPVHNMDGKLVKVVVLFAGAESAFHFTSTTQKLSNGR